MATETTIIEEESEIFSKELQEAQKRAREKLQKLIEEQGVKPMTWEQLKAMGDLWPEDENIDDFLAFLEEERSHSRQRSIDD